MMVFYVSCVCFFFFKQKTAYEMRISDWSSDVCSSDLLHGQPADLPQPGHIFPGRDSACPADIAKPAPGECVQQQSRNGPVFMEMPDCTAKPALHSRDHDRADYRRGSRGKQDNPEFCEQVLAYPFRKRGLDTLGEKGAQETVGKPRNQIGRAHVR